MSFTGTYERTLDDKFRLAVPKPLRDVLCDQENGECYLAPGNEGCVSIYSTSGFGQLAARLANISTAKADVRGFLRLLYSQAERVIVDKQSRVRIPDRLIRLAGITHEVVFIGVHDHVEIWDKTRWETYLAESSTQFDELTAQALSVPMFGV